MLFAASRILLSRPIMPPTLPTTKAVRRSCSVVTSRTLPISSGASAIVLPSSQTVLPKYRRSSQRLGPRSGPNAVSCPQTDEGARRNTRRSAANANSRPHKCAVTSAQPRWSSTRYSMTWSARPSTDGGIVRPSALAVLRLMISASLDGCSTGNSPGFAPFKIFATYPPARRWISKELGP